nr:MAG TPA: hypothetical protein [Caudoviricetes sp.]
MLPSAITDFFSADLVAAISSLLVMGIGVVIAYLIATICDYRLL